MENCINKDNLMIELFKILKKDVAKDNNKNLDKRLLCNIIIDQEELKDSEIIVKFRNLIPKFKKYYNSNMLNCLHQNSGDKQKFPAVNMLRQILKCNNLKLTPFVVSNGYDRTNGRKKVIRKYKIECLNRSNKS